MKSIYPLILLLLLVGYGQPGYATPQEQTAVKTETDTLVIRNVEFESAPAGMALKGLARMYGLNLTVEEGLDIPITLHLNHVTPAELFSHLRNVYSLEIEFRNGIWHVRRRLETDELQGLRLSWEAGRLELETQSVRLDSIGTALARKGVINLLPGTLGERRISGFVATSQPESGIRALLRSHGLDMSREAPGIFLVRELSEGTDPVVFELFAEGEYVTFRLYKAPLEQVLQEVARVLRWNVFFYGPIKGDVTAAAEAIPATRALELLLVGTGLGVRVEDQSLLVGDAQLLEFGEVRLIPLQHLKVEGLIEHLPESLKEKVALEAIPEQNGLLASGSTSALNAVDTFIKAIDHQSPQILFETLVVDYLDEVGSELGIEMGIGPPRDTTGTQTFFPEIDLERRGSNLKDEISWIDRHLQLPIVGKLPADFYFRLKALERQGRVRIRSRPQLATINGNTATLTVGTTQYFLIRSETTFAQQTVQTRISERFETIEASMSLKITPWVTATGEIITQIRPEFNTPHGTLTAEVPPTINHRIVDTTVRLMDGQTIILGGLVQETVHDEERRFPLLWRIPLLGKLFVSKVQMTSTSELMIYLTPHIYYGEEGSVIPPEVGGVL